MQSNRMNEIIDNTIKNINNLIDTTSVVGKPIITEKGEYIIPVSKVSFVMAIGGGEYGKTNLFSKNNNLPYSAGNGSFVTIKPAGFLIKNNNEYKVLGVSNNSTDYILDKTLDFLNNITKNDNE